MLLLPLLLLSCNKKDDGISEEEAYINQNESLSIFIKETYLSEIERIRLHRNQGIADFDALLTIIRQAKQKALQQVNTTLIDLYWEIGKTISQKVGKEKWGKGVVESLGNYIKQNDQISKGFSDKNLWRMKQFYETYKENKNLSALTRKIPWTHNTLIFSR